MSFLQGNLRYMQTFKERRSQKTAFWTPLQKPGTEPERRSWKKLRTRRSQNNGWTQLSQLCTEKWTQVLQKTRNGNGILNANPKMKQKAGTPFLEKIEIALGTTFTLKAMNAAGAAFFKFGKVKHTGYMQMWQPEKSTKFDSLGKQKIWANFFPNVGL